MYTRLIRNFNFIRNCSTLPKSVVDISSKTTQTKLDDPLPDKTLISITNDDDYITLSGIPKEQIHRRFVKIYAPTRNTMQSGTANTHYWKMEFDTQEKWENPLMGWASSADPMSNIDVTLTFTSQDEAIAYCEKNGWNYFVEEKRQTKIIPKSYGVNFAWNKRTRTSTK